MALSDKIYKLAVRNNKQAAKNSNAGTIAAINQIGPAVLGIAQAYRQKKDQEAALAREQQRYDYQRQLDYEKLQQDRDQHLDLLRLRGDEMSQAATIANNNNLNALERERLQQGGLTDREKMKMDADRADWKRNYRAGFDLNTSRGLGDMEAGSLAALMASGVKLPDSALETNRSYPVDVSPETAKFLGIMPGKQELDPAAFREFMQQSGTTNRGLAEIAAREKANQQRLEIGNRALDLKESIAKAEAAGESEALIASLKKELFATIMRYETTAMNNAATTGFLDPQGNFDMDRAREAARGSATDFMSVIGEVLRPNKTTSAPTGGAGTLYPTPTGDDEIIVQDFESSTDAEKAALLAHPEFGPILRKYGRK